MLQKEHRFVVLLVSGESFFLCWLYIFFFCRAGAILVIFALAVAAGVRYSKSRSSTYVLLTTQPPEEA